MKFGPRRLRAAVLGAVMVGGIGAGSLVLGATPAHAASGIQCGYGNSAGNIYSCMGEQDSSSLIAQATVEQSGRVIQTCIHGTANQLISCTPYAYKAPGQIESLTVNGSFPAGWYHENTWKEQPDGSTVLVDSEYLYVS